MWVWVGVWVRLLVRHAYHHGPLLYIVGYVSCEARAVKLLGV